METQTKYLSCQLTPEELRKFADDLAQIVQAISQEEKSQKSRKDEMKYKLSELQAKMRRLASIVSRREEYREVEVVREILTPDSGVTMIRETRLDTGEVIMTRRAVDSDCQPALITE